MQVKSYSFEASLFGQMSRIAAVVERQLETKLKDRYNLSFSQFRVLTALAQTGETAQRPLVAELGQSAALVTRQVEALVKRGLVHQQQNPASRRESLVKLTPKGARAAGEVAESVQKWQAEALEYLGLAEETQLERLLEGLHQRLTA